MAESSITMHRPRTDFMKSYVRRCKLISMWPREGTNPIRYWLAFFVVLLSGGFIELAMCVQIYRQWSNIDGVAQVIDYATVYMSALFRFLHVFVNGRRYMEMVEYMNENFIDESFNRRGKKLTMEKYVRLGKFVSLSFISMIQVWLMHMSVTPFVQYHIRRNMRDENGTILYPDLELKMTVDIPMPFETSQTHFTYLYYVTSLTSFYAMSLVYCFLDTFLIVSVVLATGQFELIAHSVRSFSERMEYESEEKDEEDERDRIEMESVIEIGLDQHIRIRQFVQIIDNLMNQCVLVDFLHAVASISFLLLDILIAMYQHTPMKMLNVVGYFTVSIFHLWVFDYFGNELTVKEEDISMAIYEIPWYNYPKKLKSHTLLMMILARKPFKLTGGKLYTLSLEFFASTVRLIFSYFTVILQLRDPPT